jgi:hypothetical protein
MKQTIEVERLRKAVRLMASKVPWGERHPNSSCDNCPARGAFCDSLGGNSCANILIAWAAKDDDGKLDPEPETLDEKAARYSAELAEIINKRLADELAPLQAQLDELKAALQEGLKGQEARTDIYIDRLKARLEKVEQPHQHYVVREHCLTLHNPPEPPDPQTPKPAVDDATRRVNLDALKKRVLDCVQVGDNDQCDRTACQLHCDIEEAFAAAQEAQGE